VPFAMTTDTARSRKANACFSASDMKVQSPVTAECAP
jgi:hypothetical protein